MSRTPRPGGALRKVAALSPRVDLDLPRAGKLERLMLAQDCSGAEVLRRLLDATDEPTRAKLVAAVVKQLPSDDPATPAAAQALSAWGEGDDDAEIDEHLANQAREALRDVDVNNATYRRWCEVMELSPR